MTYPVLMMGRRMPSPDRFSHLSNRSGCGKRMLPSNFRSNSRALLPRNILHSTPDGHLWCSLNAGARPHPEVLRPGTESGRYLSHNKLSRILYSSLVVEAGQSSTASDGPFDLTAIAPKRRNLIGAGAAHERIASTLIPILTGKRKYLSQRGR